MPYQFITSAKLPTQYGNFDIHVFENELGQEHVMLSVGLPQAACQIEDTKDICSDKNSHGHTKADMNDIPHDTNSSTHSDTDDSITDDSQHIPLVRIHSECLTGDAFASLKCDCGPQLNAAMQTIQAAGCGAILYLRQEGRGIGLTNKIRAYALQDQGHDTLDANLMLGLPADARTYDMCAPMLAHLGISQVRLLTNNPLKVDYLRKLGIDVVERVPLVVGMNEYNHSYLATKRDRMGHLIKEPITTTSTPTSPTTSAAAITAPATKK